MASNYNNYIERPNHSKNYCRLCFTDYKVNQNSKECRFNLFKLKKDGSATLSKRLHAIGLIVEEDSGLSESICRPCESKIKKLEEAQRIKESWVGVKRKAPDNEEDEDKQQVIGGKKAKIENEKKEVIDLADIDDIAKSCYTEIPNATKELEAADMESVVNFSDVESCKKVGALCPVLSSALKGAMGGKDRKSGGESASDHATRTLCYGAIFKARYPKSSNVVASRNDQLLISAGASKRSFGWFSKMGLSNGYNTALQRNGDFGAKFDTEVQAWKKDIEDDYKVILKLKEDNGVTFNEAKQLRRLTNPAAALFKIVGDNLDFEKRTRHQGKNKHNESIHWFHYMAILHRVHPSKANRTLEEYQNMPIFPGLNTQDVLSKTYKVLIARSIVTFMPSFKFLRKNVCWHIPHPFTKEMSEKSQVVPLGLSFHAENSTTEIIQIIREIQESYVPMMEVETENGETTKQIIEPLLFGGDQLTEERVINAQQGFVDCRNAYEMLQGLKPAYEDWHLKRTLYEVKEKIFRRRDSGAQHGTTEWSMNVTHSTNAKKGAKEDFNAVKEFCDIETDSLIVAAAMTHFNMNKIDDDNIPNHVKNGSDKEKHQWLQNNVEEIFKKFTVMYNVEITQKNDQEAEGIKMLKFYLCGKCENRKKMIYKTKNGRDKHEVAKHNYDRNATESTSEPNEEDTVEDEKMNHKLSYQKALFSYNLLLRSINDAIREGDGERLFELYRVAVLYFKCYGRNKYAYTVLKSFFRIQMEPAAALSLIWERFINKHGMKGYNISMDLHMEHLNNFLKELLRDLRGNVNKENAERVSKAVKNLKSIVENFEKEQKIKEQKSSKNKAKTLNDVRHLVTQFMEQNIFAEDQEQCQSYESFPAFNSDTLAKLDIDRLLQWGKRKKEEFKLLYS
ncbi:uncharacterized protein [Clytia hemisphaerica]|uniref:uncharacterized protein n=1 Tax=Clytia hemisphaerica TaxID=252671 RepID=UPI0034D5488E